MGPWKRLVPTRDAKKEKKRKKKKRKKKKLILSIRF
jgi:hypothetical protein